MLDTGPLVQALVDALVLLEVSGPDEVNPDTAVRGMENIASSLLTLSAEDQVALRREFARLAEASNEASYKKFLSSLPDMLGLA